MFKKLFDKLLNYDRGSSLIRDNFVLFTSSMILNGVGFLYHFYMGRVLGPSSYGMLGTLLSIVYLMIVPLFTIQTSITKFAAELKAKGEYGKINHLMFDALKVFLGIGIIGFILLLLAIPKISGFLSIPFFPLFILDLFLILVFLLPVVRGVLQGMQLFKSLGVNQILEGITKLSFGIFLVYVGFDVAGAIGGILISYILAFVFGFVSLRFILKYKRDKFRTKEVYLYSLPVLVVLLSLTAFYSLDLIIVRHFFDEIQSGYYAAVSLVGRTVYFATMSITLVMFPKVSELYLNNKGSKNILFKSLFFVLLIGLPLTVFYFIFSSFTISLFFGSSYLIVKNLIGFFAIVMLFFSMIYTLALYNLSVKRTKFIYILLLFNLLEIILLYLFHNTLSQIIYNILALMVILFLILLFYTLMNKNEKIINNNSSI